MPNQWIKIGNISNGGAYLGLPAMGDKLAIERDVNLETYIHTIHPQEAVLMKLQAGGDITVPFKPKDGVDELIYAFFGQEAVTDNLDGTYTHTFTAKEKDLPELDVVKQVGAVQEKYTGCKVTKLALKSPADGEMELTVTLVAKTGEHVTGEAAPTSFDKSKTFRVQNASLTWGGVEFIVGNAEVTFDRDIADDGFALDANSGRTLTPEGNFSAEVKLDVLTDDVTFLQDFLAGTEKPLVLTFTTPDGETVAIHLPNAVVIKRSKASNVDKKLLIEDVQVAGLDDGTNGAAYVELTNNIASYPRT